MASLRDQIASWALPPAVVESLQAWLELQKWSLDESPPASLFALTDADLVAAGLTRTIDRREVLARLANSASVSAASLPEPGAPWLGSMATV